jgi:hypothetical protein
MGKRSSKKSAAPTVSEALDTAVAVLVKASETPPSATTPHGPPVLESLTRESTEADLAYGGAYTTPKAPAKKSKFESTFSKTAVISAVKANPKKPGSAAHQRYNLYKVGMTVDEALKAGLRSEDIRWDSGRGFITLK